MRTVMGLIEDTGKQETLKSIVSVHCRLYSETSCDKRFKLQALHKSKTKL